jgi:hypothetical protein
VAIGSDTMSFIYYPALDFAELDVLEATTYNTFAFEVAGIYNTGESVRIVWNGQEFFTALTPKVGSPGVFTGSVTVPTPDANWFKPESTLDFNIVDLDGNLALDVDFALTLEMFDADLGVLFFDPDEGSLFDFGTRDFREDLSDIGQPLLILDMSDDRNVALNIKSNDLQYFNIDEGFMTFAALSADTAWVYDIYDDMLLLEITPKNGLRVGIWTETIVLTIGYLAENGEDLIDGFEVEFEARVRINPLDPELPVLINAFPTGFAGEIGIVVDWPEIDGYDADANAERRIVAILYDCEVAAYAGAGAGGYIQWIYVDPDNLEDWLRGAASDGYGGFAYGFSGLPGQSFVNGLPDGNYWITLRLDTTVFVNGDRMELTSAETTPRLGKLAPTNFLINWQTGGGTFDRAFQASFLGGESIELPDALPDGSPAGGDFVFQGWYYDRDFEQKAGDGGATIYPVSSGGQFQNITLWARWERVQVPVNELLALGRNDIRIRQINGSYNVPLGRGVFELFNTITGAPIIDKDNLLDIRILTGNANLITFTRNAAEGVFTYNALRTGSVAVQVQVRLGGFLNDHTTVETRIITVR